jgi:hypothetical protein
MMRGNYSLFLLASASLAALILGSIGFHDLDPEQGWFTSVYKAIQLFSMESGVIEAKQTPVGLEVSRWLALGALVGGIYATLFSLLSGFSEARRLAGMRDHAIVCGVGNRGGEIAKAFLRCGNRRVVIIENDEGNGSLGELRGVADASQARLCVLSGNALDEAILIRAGVRSARVLVAVTGRDDKNLSICAEAERMNGACVLSAGVESWAWRAFCLDRIGSRIRLDSYLSRAARSLTLEIACEAVQDERIRAEGIRVLIEASPEMRQEFVRAAALNFQISGDRRPILELTASSEEEERAFAERFPAWALVVDLRWHRESASGIFAEKGSHCPDFAVFALGEDVRTLEVAERCRMRNSILSHRVFACVRLDSDFLELLSMKKKTDDFQVRNLFRLGLGSTDPTEADIEHRARVCHGIYFRSERSKNPNYGNNLGDLPEEWERLPERVRESNRLAAMHHEVKRVAWEHRGEKPPLELLHQLSRCEHMRWMAEKVMDGWRWSGSVNKESRDNSRLRHHLLVSYDALDQPEKDKDFNAFLWALSLSEVELNQINLSEEVKMLVLKDFSYASACETRASGRDSINGNVS